MGHVVNKNRLEMKIPTGKCWVDYSRCPGIKGYVNVTINGRSRSAHSVSYEFFVGEIQNGLVIDHLCFNRECYNPSHLELCTPSENVQRGASSWAQRTHCLKGHNLSDEHAKTYRNRRNCLTCLRERRQSYAKNKRRLRSAARGNRSLVSQRSSP